MEIRLFFLNLHHSSTYCYMYAIQKNSIANMQRSGMRNFPHTIIFGDYKWSTNTNSFDRTNLWNYGQNTRYKNLIATHFPIFS